MYTCSLDAKIYLAYHNFTSTGSSISIPNSYQPIFVDIDPNGRLLYSADNHGVYISQP